MAAAEPAHTVAGEAGTVDVAVEERRIAVGRKALEEHHTAVGRRAAGREAAGEEEGLGCSHIEACIIDQRLHVVA